VPGPPHSPEMVESIHRAMDDGGMHCLGLATDDCRKQVEELKSRGVQFIQDAEERPYGVEAVMRDNSDNRMVLVEHKAYTHAGFEDAGA
jgi:TRAP-type C4-dicarboxylate transport system substrate-binding protein